MFEVPRNVSEAADGGPVFNHSHEHINEYSKQLFSNFSTGTYVELVIIYIWWYKQNITICVYRKIIVRNKFELTASKMSITNWTNNLFEGKSLKW